MAKKYSQGQNVTKNLSASGLNRATDAGEAYANQKTTGLPAKDTRFFNSHTEVLIKNVSGSDRTEGAALKLGDFSLDEIENNFLWFEGDVPVDRIAPYAVLLRPIPINERGPALMTGLCKAWVDIQHISHRWADSAMSADNLVSWPTGSARILTPLAETGLQICAIQLGMVYRGPLIGKATSDIPSEGNGTARLWLPNNYAAETDWEVDLDVRGWIGGDVFAGDRVEIFEQDGVYYIANADCSGG